jgi:hypothetical protein
MVIRRCSTGRLPWWLLFVFIVAGIGIRTRHASAQELSGTIRYTGSKGGQVSDSRPILIALQSQIGAKTEVDRQSVTTNGGAFTLHAPVAGQYFLYYLLDVINVRDGSGFPGEPAGIYNRRDGSCTFQGDPIMVPQSGLNLEFDDACVLTGIGGTVTYTGNLSGRGIIVQAFTDPDLNTPPAATYIYARNGGYYGVITFDTNVYYLRALLDVNGDGIFEPGEPFAICAAPIQAGPDQTGVTITFGDGGASTCIVPPLPTPTPTETPPPTPTPSVTPTPSAVTLSGTIVYTGTHGPVSNDRPIRIFVSTGGTSQKSFIEGFVSEASVTTNGGPFHFDLPIAGSYYLSYGLDLNNDHVGVGDPFGAYNSRSSFPLDPIVVPQSGVSINFNDAQILSGVAGKLTYSGSKGPVSENQPLIAQGFTDPNLSGVPAYSGDLNETGVNGGEYQLVILNASTYYLRAFLDLNGNHTLDPGEPFEIYNNRSTPPGDPVVASTTQTNINFSFGDENVCVGDCNGDGEVTISEIITCVNIALGTADVSMCSACDADHNGEVEVNEIIQAVNNALTGCPSG